MNDYSLRILYILNLKEMTGYGLSKQLFNSATGKNISNGALIPVLNRLMADNFITFNIRKGKKYYLLTDKGKKFVSNVLDLNEEVRDQAIFDAIDREFPYINVFTDIGDYNVLKELIREIGHPIIEIIRQVFYLRKNGDEEAIDNIKKMLQNVLDEARERNINKK
ncbi:MAG: PadR family transcriptional regulator [Ferroplasma sp.]|uniref:PadR family transcriptional regulator n=1 Tax=Ferroplasma sp. TaxID=2591003 RepID=UPI0028154D0B|nr:PadR family transcriptional regulator [Ferroplasma sp.]WMT50430.1 MAG: PadR family transcriptional regulator [Ferroplasma sp.]